MGCVCNVDDSIRDWRRSARLLSLRLRKARNDLAAERESHAAQVSAMLEERAGIERERDAYRAMLCDLLACHGRVSLGGEFDGDLWVRARRLLAEGP